MIFQFRYKSSDTYAFDEPELRLQFYDQKSNGSTHSSPLHTGVRWLVKRSWRCATVTAGILSVVVCSILAGPVLIHLFRGLTAQLPNTAADILNITADISNNTTTDLTSVARQTVNTLYARQSTTVTQASARYSLCTGRPPPANFANWFRFAQEKHCLIDEYNQIHRNFKPFYQLAEDDTTAFQTMIERARRRYEFPSLSFTNQPDGSSKLAGSDAEIAYVEVLNGEVLMEGGTLGARAGAPGFQVPPTHVDRIL